MPSTIYPGFDSSERTIEAIRESLRGRPDGLRDIAGSISNYSKATAKKAIRKEFVVTHSTISKIIKSNHITKKPYFFETVWDWLHHVKWTGILEERLGGDYLSERREGMATVHALLDFIDPDSRYHAHAHLTALTGTYRLFRRSFIHPQDEIHVSPLVCGLPESPEKWQLSTLHEREHEAEKAEQAHGCIVPSGDKFLLVGGLVPKTAPVSMIVEPIGVGNRPGLVTEATGIIMVGAAGRPPSAHPFYMHRVSDTFPPAVIDKNDLSQNSFKEWKRRISNELKRNYINSL